MTVAELTRPDVEPPSGPAPDDLVIEDITVGDGSRAGTRASPA
jgi:peptidylprolyl isomerase